MAVESGSTQQSLKAAFQDLEKDLQNIHPPSKKPSRKSDEKYQEEITYLDLEQRKRQYRLDEAHVRGIEQDQEDRERYTRRIFWLMVGWMGIVLGIIIATGVKVPNPKTPTLPSSNLDWVSIGLLVAILCLGIGQIVNRGVTARLIETACKANWRSWIGFSAWVLIPIAALIVVVVRSASPAANPAPLSAWISAFDLPEAVVLVLIGSTTANVFGLFVIVARYLFPRKKDDRSLPPRQRARLI